VHQFVDQTQQRTEMEVVRQRRVEEERLANQEERASPDRIARPADGTILAQPAELIKVEQARDDTKCALEMARLTQIQADELRRIQEVNARLEHEREALRQSMVGVSYPHLRTNLCPTSFSAPMFDPYPHSAPLFPLLQPFYPQAQGVISLQNVSGANISINSFSPPPPPPVISNINSGNISSVSLSNVINNNAKCAYPSRGLTYFVLTLFLHPARRKRQA